tara:strand:+ start:344 stop:1246 length:903 start_codon:yes stop_codon:yes gene_type:complete
MSNFQQITNSKLDSLVSAVNNASTISHSRKTLANGTTPQESITTGTDKHAVLLQGVDANSAAVSEANCIRVDGNGVQYVSNVTTTNVAPANSANGELSPTQSFEVRITGNDGFDGAGTNRVIQTTTQGRLLVDVVELASSGPISNSTSLGSLQVCGHDSVTNRFKTISVDANGKQEIVPAVTKSATEITLDKDDVALSGSIANNMQTKWVDIGAARSIRVLVQGMSSGGTPIILGLEGSQTTQLGDFELIEEKTANLAQSPSAGMFLAFKLLDVPYGFVRLRNDSGGSISFTKISVNLIN